MQLVDILKVFHAGVNVMHPTKQPNKEVKTLDDVSHAEFADESFVMWGKEYLNEIAPPAQRAKTK